MTFDYKTYSLDKLKEWVHDAINSGDVTATEVYNAITSVVEEQIDYHTKNLANLNELNTLLNNNHSEQYDVVMREKEYYEPTMPPWGHSDMEALKYTDKELNSMCDAAEFEEKHKMSYKQAVAAGWHMTDDGFWIPPENKTKSWIMNVEMDGLTGDCYINLPDEICEKCNWKENDTLEWIPQQDNSYILKKVDNEQ